MQNTWTHQPGIPKILTPYPSWIIRIVTCRYYPVLLLTLGYTGIKPECRNLEATCGIVDISMLQSEIRVTDVLLTGVGVGVGGACKTPQPH